MKNGTIVPFCASEAVEVQVSNSAPSGEFVPKRTILDGRLANVISKSEHREGHASVAFSNY